MNDVPRRPSAAMDELAEELAARGLVEQTDFFISGRRPHEMRSSEYIGLREHPVVDVVGDHPVEHDSDAATGLAEPRLHPDHLAGVGQDLVEDEAHPRLVGVGRRQAARRQRGVVEVQDVAAGVADVVQRRTGRDRSAEQEAARLERCGGLGADQQVGDRQRRPVERLGVARRRRQLRLDPADEQLGDQGRVTEPRVGREPAAVGATEDDLVTDRPHDPAVARTGGGVGAVVPHDLRLVHAGLDQEAAYVVGDHRVASRTLRPRPRARRTASSTNTSRAASKSSVSMNTFMLALSGYQTR